MDNFKGGFAFNNEAAKVEVEQSPNGALISCINPVTGESMGGGNPNSVQVITGTLANPWGEEYSRAPFEAMILGNANAMITIDLSELGAFEITAPVYLFGTGQDAVIVSSGAVMGAGASVANAYTINWNVVSGALIYAGINTDGEGTDIASIASQIPTTLTIYWHPMPEAEGE